MMPTLANDQATARLSTLLQKDAMRMQVLTIVRELALSDCYVAAGFIRNLVWDDLHTCETALNDIDVVYFDKSDTLNVMDSKLTLQLNRQYPAYNWQVKNQAYMHSRNHDSPYLNTLDAMSYWPEKETAVAARLLDDDSIAIISAFGLESLLAGKITYNNKRAQAVFLQRVTAKRWLQTWPQLRVEL